MPILAVDKPLGPSSHAVVADARRRLGTRRVGHAGTLDPLASGLLLLLTEGATKLSPFLTGSDKDYLAWVAFGAATATLDAEGPVTARSDPSALTRAAIVSALPPFLAMSEQRPPAFSAIKRAGVPAYREARRGGTVELAPRPAGYRALTLLAFEPDRNDLPQRFAPTADGRWAPAEAGYAPDLPAPLEELPTALVWLRVRAGTYVRAFARDLGEVVGLPSHLAGLVRTRAGKVGLESAAPLGALAAARSLRPADVLPYPEIRLDADSARRVRSGQRLPLALEGRALLVDPDGRLAAVAEGAAGRMKLLRVWQRDYAE